MKKFLVTFLFISATISVLGQTDLIPKVVKTTLGTYVGYANNAGELVIPAQYKEASPFYNGLARVKNDEGLYGFINKNGEEVIPFKFSQANDFYRNTVFGEIKAVGLSFVTEMITEEYKKKTNLSFEYNRGQSLTSTRKVGRSNIINTKGEYMVPFDFEGEATIEGDFVMIYFSKDKKSFSALIDEEHNVVFGPVPGGIHVAENYIIVTYGNAEEINGQYNSLSELYDLEGNRILGVEKRYSQITFGSGNPKFLTVNRKILLGDKVISKTGLIDQQGNEIIQTLFERIVWESDLKLFRVLIESNKYIDNEDLDVYFYANEKGECVEKENVPCPAPPPAGFDYEAFISKGHKIVKDINETAEIPWLYHDSKSKVTTANNSTETEIDKNNSSTGEGQVFIDMNGIWVQSPPPPSNGKIFKIDKIQKNAICGDYKNLAGTQVFEAKLKCIHASEDGYIFYLDYYNRPSWSKGKHYLHVIKKEKKGKIKYKITVFNDFFDTSFEQQKLAYYRYVQTAKLGQKGYNSSWWFWSVYK